MNKYFAIEVSFNENNKWEQIGERYPYLHLAVEHMEEIDLTFPTRIVKVTRQVVLAEIHGKRIKPKRVVKKTSK